MIEPWIENLIGVRYVEYGNSPEEGFHCAGLCRYAIQKRFGVALPTDPLEWRTRLRYLPWPCRLTDWDIVLMGIDGEEHIGLAMNGGMDILHSWRAAGGVVLVRLERMAPVIQSAARLKDT